MFADAGCGPFSQVEALGDVILIGMLLSVASSCALFFFDDECTLGEESEAINHSASGASAAYALVLRCGFGSQPESCLPEACVLAWRQMHAGGPFSSI